MRFLLIYYTGTYNTRYLTNQIEQRLCECGHTVERVEINRNTPPVCTEGFDYIGIGYPIYGFNSPLPLNRYLSRLVFSPKQKFFIYKNSGETFAMNNASSRIILRRFKRKKLLHCGEYHFVMPYNIHFAFDRDFVREILVENKKLMEVMLHNLFHGVSPQIRSNIAYDLAAAVVSVQKVGGNVNSFLYRVDAEKCVNCGLCVKNCPENNIRVEKDKIKFGHRCDMCMRCSFFCPKNAVKIGFLEGWKVNGDYNLPALERAGAPETPYITEKSQGFYKCFIRHFADIDREYRRIFGEEQA